MGIDNSINKKQVPIAPLFQFLWLVSLFVAHLTYSNGVDKVLIHMILIHFYTTVLRHLFSKSLKCGRSSRFVSLDVLFFIGCYLVYLLPYQLYVADTLELDYSRFLLFNTYSAYSNNALILTSVCITSFSIGWEISTQNSARLRPSHKTKDKLLINLNSDLSTVRRLNKLNLASLFFLLLIYSYSGLRSSAETRYGSNVSVSALGEALYFLLVLFSILSFAGWIFLRSHSEKIDHFTRIAIFLSVIWQFRVLIAGDRNSFFLIAMVQLCGYAFFVRKPSTFVLLSSCALATYLYVVIENFRSESEKNFSSFMEISSFEKLSVFGESSLNITTISIRALLQMYDESGQLYFGLFKLIGILGIVPFSRGLLLPDSVAISDTSQLVTVYIFGNQPHWQVGTSLISDSFIDFGFMGVVLIPLVYGYIGARFQKKAREFKSLKVIVMFLIFLASYLQLPRYSADFPVRMLVWTWLLLVVIEKSKGTLRYVNGK